MTSKKNQNTGIVYSTDIGEVCPTCGNSIKKCNCANETAEVPGDGIVRISRETKGRKGAGVSLITGVPLKDKDLKALAKRLKQKCGTGGTIKSGVIEIQGDHREVLKNELLKQGYTVKLAGG